MRMPTENTYADLPVSINNLMKIDKHTQSHFYPPRFAGYCANIAHTLQLRVWFARGGGGGGGGGGEAVGWEISTHL